MSVEDWTCEQFEFFDLEYDLLCSQGIREDIAEEIALAETETYYKASREYTNLVRLNCVLNADETPIVPWLSVSFDLGSMKIKSVQLFKNEPVNKRRNPHVSKKQRNIINVVTTCAIARPLLEVILGNPFPRFQIFKDYLNNFSGSFEELFTGERRITA